MSKVLLLHVPRHSSGCEVPGICKPGSVRINSPDRRHVLKSVVFDRRAVSHCPSAHRPMRPGPAYLLALRKWQSTFWTLQIRSLTSLAQPLVHTYSPLWTTLHPSSVSLPHTQTPPATFCCSLFPQTRPAVPYMQARPRMRGTVHTNLLAVDISIICMSAYLA